MKRFTVEDLWAKVPNKYEAIVAIALEARRLARWAREHEVRLQEKPTILALQRFLEGKVRYTKAEEQS